MKHTHTLTYDLTFNSQPDTRKNQDQRLFASTDRVETDGQTDTTDRIIFLANAVGNNFRQSGAVGP